jgi:hypothetical protein
VTAILPSVAAVMAFRDGMIRARLGLDDVDEQLCYPRGGPSCRCIAAKSRRTSGFIVSPGILGAAR